MRYWKRVNKDGKITTVESYSHDLDVEGALEIGKVEFDAYLASLPKPILSPLRDLASELDTLKAEVEALKSR